MSYTDKPSLDELVHYGTPMHSGRYPWGSGEEPYQHSGDFVSRVNALRKEGKTDTQIAEYFKMSTTNFRKEYTLANNERKYNEYQQAKSLRDKGYSNYKIGEIMGKNESTIRSMLDTSHTEAKQQEARSTYEFLKKRIDEKKFIDVGKDVERELNISRTKLDEALYMLEMEDYKFYERYLDQPTNNNQKTTFKIVCPPGTTYDEFINGEYHSLSEYTSTNDGQTFHKRNVYPKSMDSSRLKIRYADDVDSDGIKGIEKDGIIEIRRGVDDLSLGNSKYAQVRILVDNDRYLKGMAVYSDDMPDGVDVVFNTNKTSDVPMRKVLKEIKNNPDNPFGSNIKDIESGGQYYYKDKNGKEQLGLINKKSDEGDWEDWSNNLPSQFLSKQPIRLAKKQIDLAVKEQLDEYEKICSLENPTVKKQLLHEFAENCDTAAVHLKAAALPKQQYHVIIPIGTLKDTEVYAPNYNDGEQVALIRYPHGGTFEIPILTVNNRNATAKKLLGSDVVDAVGINSKVAERLSGADFDGDTVMVIPTNSKIGIKSTDHLPGLKGFDPKMEYKTKEVINPETGEKEYYNHMGIKIKPMKATQLEMGKISNLITDMTIGGANNTEIERAVKHSMVVIDAEKHKLDYKRSEIDNDIRSLKIRYQGVTDPETGKISTSAATLISRAKGEVSVVKRQGTPKYNIKYNKKGEINEWYDPNKPEGSLIYKTADDAYYPAFVKPGKKDNPKYVGYRLANGKKVMFDPDNKEEAEYFKPVKVVDKDTGDVYFTNKTGELRYKTKVKLQASTRMAETDDATTLISFGDKPMERLYANYANRMKALANQARKEEYNTGEIEYSPAANTKYKKEVSDLLYKLNEAEKNSPRERLAVVYANNKINAQKQSNPNMSKEDLKKFKQQAMESARDSVGAKRKKIEITDREWEAIQSGAVSKTRLKSILKYADMDIVREKAMPRSSVKLSPSQVNSLRAKAATKRYTNAELASFYGISPGAVANYINGKE